MLNNLKYISNIFLPILVIKFIKKAVGLTYISIHVIVLYGYQIYVSNKYGSN